MKTLDCKHDDHAVEQSPEQLRQPDISFGSDNSNDRLKRFCLVSWTAAPCV